MRTDLERGFNAFSTSSSEASFIGGSQNLVYEYQQNEQEYMLRFTPLTHRSEQMIKSELDWIHYLAGEGVAVSTPILSRNGNWTEEVHTPREGYTCVSFVKAPGKQIEYPECLQDANLYERLGRCTGKLHALSKRYRPDEQNGRRHDWSCNWFLQNMELLPISHTAVRNSGLRLMESIRSLPQPSDSFGLIHGDINVGNFRVNEQGVLTLFDFDEAQYSWFVEEIAIQLYYLVYVYGGRDGQKLREEQTRRFMGPFMKGYLHENPLDESWIKQIPLFLRLRELIVYIGAFRNWDGVDETFSNSDNGWFKDWIAESRARIENEVPIVDIWG
ncbi:phosphotransferase [Gorillibacterium sp. CAU 1737]|uniref:phosphotransferase enzyme family protein n=1 Tax=Gorillibacterium sp. CAU 1737 TaxID=3140362 RepID=UPI0032619B21